jgi:hypothetical protein
LKTAPSPQERYIERVFTHLSLPLHAHGKSVIRDFLEDVTAHIQSEIMAAIGLCLAGKKRKLFLLGVGGG